MSHPRSSVTPLSLLTPEDFPALAALAGLIWRAHYIPIIGAAQVDYMLAQRTAPEAMAAYVGAADRWLHLWREAAEGVDLGTTAKGALVGYCSHSELPDPREMKLEQLYVRPDRQGRGIGARMLGFVEDNARARGRDRLVLTVNRHNTGSIAFYRRAGFEVREAARFDIGQGYFMDDFIMVKSLI